MSRLQDVINRDVRANQPLATAVPIGNLYGVSDEGVVERSNGTTWDPFTGSGAGGKMLTVSTTGNIDNLVIGNVSTLRFTNASLSTLRGITAGTDGQELLIISTGAGEVDLAHQNTNSTAANRLINFVTSGVTPLAPGLGTAKLRYNGTIARWRLVEHEQGAYIAVPFSAGNFTGSGAMTWTVTGGQVQEYTFFIRGAQITVNINVGNSTIGGTPDLILQATLPNSYTVNTVLTVNNCRVQNSGSLTSGGLIFAGSGTSSTKVNFYRDGTGTTNWSAGATNAGVFGTLPFAIN